MDNGAGCGCVWTGYACQREQRCTRDADQPAELICLSVLRRVCGLRHCAGLYCHIVRGYMAMKATLLTHNDGCEAVES